MLTSVSPPATIKRSSSSGRRRKVSPWVITIGTQADGPGVGDQLDQLGLGPQRDLAVGELQVAGRAEPGANLAELRF